MTTQYDISGDKELLAYVGRAVYESQRLEVNLAHIIRHLHLLTGCAKGGDLLKCLQELKRVLDSRLKRTLGSLLKEIRKIAKLDDVAERLLSEALESRNDIVHHFFYNHWVVAIEPVARDAMICELKEAIETISAGLELSKRIEQQLETQFESKVDKS